MIREEKGRARSERTLNEQIQLLQQDIKSLSAEERETLLVALQELEATGAANDVNAAPTLLDTFARVEWERQPVDVETFIKDEYYLGKTCDNLYPKLLEDMKELFSGGYHECVLSGCVDLDATMMQADGELVTLRSLLARGGDSPALMARPDGRVGATASCGVKHSGVQPTVRVTLANGMSLRLTPDHRVMTQRGWVAAAELLTTDLVPVPRRLVTTPSYSLAEAEAQLIGYMTGDGSSDATRARFVDGNSGTVQDFLKMLRACGFAAASVRPKNGASEVCVEYSKRSGFLDLLRRHGIFDVGSLSRRASPLVCRSSDAVVAAFLRGLYACEGTVVYKTNTAPRIQIGLANRGLIDDVQWLLMRLGIHGRVYPARSFHKKQQRHYQWWHLSISDKENIERFLETIGSLPGKEAACDALRQRVSATTINTNVDVLPWTYADMGRFLQGKGIVRARGSRWWKWVEAAPPTRCSYRSVVEFCLEHAGHPAAEELRQRFVDPGLRYEGVRSVEPAETIEVGDIGIPNGNSFFCQGFQVHNSIGWGKTFFASIGVCRLLYELSCMRDPQKSYGLAPGSVIAITCFSVNEMLAMKVVFENIVNKLQASPYFKEHFPYELTKKEMRFPSKKLWLAARASTDSSALGLNTIGALVDETNFMPDIPKALRGRMGSEVTGRAQSIYNTIKRRMKSRFSRQGQLPGMLFIVSSKKTKDDFTAKLIRSMKTDPSMFVRDYAQWDVKPEEFFTAQKFPVLCGNESTPSKILTEDEAAVLRSKELDEGLVILDVPEEFRSDFENDLEGAIRDIGGISTVAMSPFIQRREKLVAAVDERLSHPFSTLEYQIGTASTFEWGRMVRAHKNHHGETIWQPLINPAAARHVHIDPSLTGDCTGLVMAHIAGMKDVVRRKDGKQHVERLPIFLVDLALRIRPPTAGEIDLGDVRQLVYMLREHGYRITQLTMDRYNSADTLQQVRKKGIKSELLSVDVKPEPYEHLKTAFYEERVVMYDYPPLLQELQQLEKDHRKNKVDHPAMGSKDIADALAGTLYSLSQTRGTGSALPILPGVSYSPRDATPSQMGYAPGTRGLSILVGSGGGGGGYVMDDDEAWSDL